MFENGGCGLAAPQVGETIQLAIVDTEYTSEKDYDPYVLINPVIVEQSDNLVPYNEGCLSIPGINCEISRPDHVVVEAYNLEGECIRYEAAGDLFCVCLQHEIDHLARQDDVRAPAPQAAHACYEAVSRGACSWRKAGRDGVAMRVVFMGTPAFAVPSLRKLAAAHDVALVLTRPDAVRSRGKKLEPSPVKEAALGLGLP